MILPSFCKTCYHDELLSNVNIVLLSDSEYYLGDTNRVYHRVRRFDPLTETASASVAALADDDFKLRIS